MSLGSQLLGVAPRIEDAWLTDAVLGLAAEVYEHRVMPEGTLGPARLAAVAQVLAIAMDETGLKNSRVLAHLREEVKHWRRCWLIDGILARS